jgi:hypothetical protein
MYFLRVNSAGHQFECEISDHEVFYVKVKPGVTKPKARKRAERVWRFYCNAKKLRHLGNGWAAISDTPARCKALVLTFKG